MWVDQETDQDLVNFAGIAKTIAQIIMEPNLTPLTVGVHGDWGYGKSSVLRMVRAQLDDMGALTLYFNGWAFEGFEDAKVALMESIVSELIKHKSLFNKAKDECIKLAKRVRWFKVAGKLASVGWTLSTGDPTTLALSAAQSLGEKDGDGWLKAAEEDAPYHHIHAFREDFTALLKKADIKRLVVLVDDLDRCLPEDAISTLEAIRLFLSVEGSTFVIGADETMIEYAVRRHFPELDTVGGTVGARSPSFTKNYLEKLIQLPFRLPQLNMTETRRYITLLLVEEALRGTPHAFNKVLESVRADDSQPWQELNLDEIVRHATVDATDEPTKEVLKERLRVAAQISRPIAERYAGNPRQVKRFLNTLMLRAGVAKAYNLSSNVRLPVLAKLMVLERQNGDAYAALSTQVASSRQGRVANLKGLEKRAHEGREDKTKEIQADELEAVFGKIGFDKVAEWLAIEPDLGALDLRPYFFVSRERLVDFVGLESLQPAELELLEALESGKPGLIASKASQIAQLDRQRANEIAEALLGRVSEVPDLSREPEALKHFAAFSKDRPDVQIKFLQFLQNLPMAHLGAWAPARLRAICRHADSVTAATALIEAWSKQQDNKPLAAAAAATKNLGPVNTNAPRRDIIQVWKSAQNSMNESNIACQRSAATSNSRIWMS